RLATETRQVRSREGRSSELSLEALAIASVASLVATIVLSRFGLAGTLTGAALTPVIVTVVKELAGRPARRIVRPLTDEASRLVNRPSGAPQPSAEPPPQPAAAVEERPVFREPWWTRVRWKTTLAVAALAFAICVAFFTLPELLLGQSLTSDRGSTFFSEGPQSPQPPAPTTPTEPTATVTTTVATTTVTATATVPSATAPTATAPTAPTAPAPTAPVPTAPAPTAPTATAPVP
ncbi:MAG: hypothetical protein QOK40_1434, partial [Miltoncostaeaceae bacterium]|nr:hypothetical protein [Miltoncostaeaceae bacterium]